MRGLTVQGLRVQANRTTGVRAEWLTIVERTSLRRCGGFVAADWFPAAKLNRALCFDHSPARPFLALYAHVFRLCDSLVATGGAGGRQSRNQIVARSPQHLLDGHALDFRSRHEEIHDCWGARPRHAQASSLVRRSRGRSLDAGIRGIATVARIPCAVAKRRTRFESQPSVVGPSCARFPRASSHHHVRSYV